MNRKKVLWRVSILAMLFTIINFAAVLVISTATLLFILDSNGSLFLAIAAFFAIVVVDSFFVGGPMLTKGMRANYLLNYPLSYRYEAWAKRRMEKEYGQKTLP